MCVHMPQGIIVKTMVRVVVSVERIEERECNAEPRIDVKCPVP